MEFYEKILSAKNNNDNIAVATVVKTEGSTPRHAGSKLICYPDGSVFGTVGGGIVEKGVIEDCLACIESGAPLLKTYNAVETGSADKGSICGNNMTVFIEPILAAPHLYIFGAGHVAQAVIPLAKSIGYYVTVIDSREPGEYMKNLEAADRFVKIDSFENIGNYEFARGAYFIVCTFAHALDGIVLKTALESEPKYVGMLGGAPKIKALLGSLKQQGFSEETLRGIHTPIGLDIGGETPNEIALSIMAELTAVRYSRPSGFSKDNMKDCIFPLTAE